MFDVGFSELFLLAIVALVVLGPEKLPHAARMAGAWLGRIRRTILSVQAEIENEVAASEMRARIQAELERAKAALPEVTLDDNHTRPSRPATAGVEPDPAASMTPPANRESVSTETPPASEPPRTP